MEQIEIFKKHFSFNIEKNMQYTGLFCQSMFVTEIMKCELDLILNVTQC